jgi:pimeloyl-ACP methyl ester carboxylesterase
MTIPSFCRRDADFADDERPLRLAPSTISVETAYGQMQVKVWIGGHGFPIVVLHGLSANSRIYLLWLGFLALFFKVIAVDLPGHGGTDPLPRGCEYMAGSGLVLTSVLDTLGVNYVGIIAHSMGARIGCEMSSRTPNRVVVLILVDPVTGAAWDRRMRNVRRLPLLFAPLAAEFLQDFAALLARIRQTDRSADLIRLGFDTYIGHVQHPMRSFAPTTLSLINAPPSVPLLEAIAQAGVPTVVMWGDHDRLVSRACAEGTAETTNARLIVVQNSGHSWPLQNRNTARHILVESLADDLAPDSLGILLSKAVTRHAHVNARIATQATLETSPLYSHNALAQALTPPAAYWEKGTPGSEPRVSWTHQLIPHPAVA